LTRTDYRNTEKVLIVLFDVAETQKKRKLAMHYVILLQCCIEQTPTQTYYLFH